MKFLMLKLWILSETMSSQKLELHLVEINVNLGTNAL